MYKYYPKPAHLPLLHPCPHCSSTVRLVTKKLIWPVLSVCILLLLHIAVMTVYMRSGSEVVITSPRFVTLHRLVSKIAKCTGYLFYKNYIFYNNVYCYYCSVFIEKYVYTKFRLHWLLCPSISLA